MFPVAVVVSRTWPELSKSQSRAPFGATGEESHHRLISIGYDESGSGTVVRYRSTTPVAGYGLELPNVRWSMSGSLLAPSGNVTCEMSATLSVTGSVNAMSFGTGTGRESSDGAE